MKQAFLVAVFVWAIACASYAENWGNPTGFFEQEKILRRDVVPGVVSWKIQGTLRGEPLEVSVVTVDALGETLQPRILLGDRGVALKKGQRFRRSKVSELLKDNPVVAGINVAFFQIASTQTPLGLVLKDGMVYRDPSGRWPSLVFTKDGRALLGALGWAASIMIGAQKRPLGGVNKPEFSKDEVILYQPPWVESPGNSMPFTKNEEPFELVLKKTDFQPADDGQNRAMLFGQVVEIRKNQPGVAMGADQFVLTATRSAAPFFRRIQKGDKVGVSWELSGLPAEVSPAQVREILSAGPVLLKSGKVTPEKSDFWIKRHPRSAVAIAADHKRLALVLVDGRSKKSVGISLGDLADFLAHLGAYEGLNLDGGGSSALGVKIGGVVEIMNQPSDKAERLVPVGFGIEFLPQKK